MSSKEFDELYGMIQELRGHMSNMQSEIDELYNMVEAVERSIHE